MATPDPVQEAKAYQDHLSSLVGADDPERVQSETPARLRALARSAGEALRTAPAPGEWSPLECLGHIVDAEMVYATRYRWIVAHDAPPLIGYDQDRWVASLRHNEGDPERLLRVFEVLREENLRFWARTSEQDRARAGLHAERGPETLGLSFRLIAGHDRFHLQQMEETIRAVSARA